MSTPKFKVLLGPSSFASRDKLPRERLIAAGCELIENPHKRKLTKDELLGLLGQDVVGLIAGLETLDDEVFKTSKLKILSRCGAGMNNVDQVAAAKRGVRVYSTPDAPTNAVAELTLGCALALLRGLPQANQAVHQKQWPKNLGGELRGKTVAIIGYGRIGRRVADLMRAFGAKIIAVDPLAQSSNEATALPLAEALPKADIVSIHAGGAERVLSAAEFAQMKKGAYLLNAARGELIDETALVDNIKSGHLAGAWIDTFEQEPYQGPLCDLPQVILTPHIGSYTDECRSNMELETAENLLRGLKDLNL